MSTEQPKNQNRNKPNITPKKFNFYWIYGLIAIVIIGLNFFDWGGSPAELKDIKKFNSEMLQKGHVEKIVIVNNEFAEIFIKPDSLNREPYLRDKVPQKGAQYKIDITSPVTFAQNLSDFQSSWPEEKDYMLKVKPVTIT